VSAYIESIRDLTEELIDPKIDFHTITEIRGELEGQGAVIVIDEKGWRKRTQVLVDALDDEITRGEIYLVVAEQWKERAERAEARLLKLERGDA
jgi:hypothetical protein